MASLEEYLDQLMEFLMQNQADPGTFLLIFFLLSVATAVLLPIPIEIALIWNPGVFFPIKALVLGLGKGVGAIAVFYIGAKIDWLLRRLSGRRFFGWWLRKADALMGMVESAVLRSGRSASFAKALSLHTPVRHSLEKSLGKRAVPSWLHSRSESFVRRYGILAMYFIMSIPGMVDTIPLYLFSILNEEGTLMRLRDFALANFLAGINRAFLIFAVLELLGIRLFSLA